MSLKEGEEEEVTHLLESKEEQEEDEDIYAFLNFDTSSLALTPPPALMTTRRRTSSRSHSSSKGSISCFSLSLSSSRKNKKAVRTRTAAAKKAAAEVSAFVSSLPENVSLTSTSTSLEEEKTSEKEESSVSSTNTTALGFASPLEEIDAEIEDLELCETRLEDVVQIDQEQSVLLKTPDSLACWTSRVNVKTPSPSVARQLKEEFDEELRCAPSAGNTADQAEHDSFFSFAHSLSPLVATDEFEQGLLPLRLSPLMAMGTSELPRLVPPFPLPKFGDSPPGQLLATLNNTPPCKQVKQSTRGFEEEEDKDEEDDDEDDEDESSLIEKTPTIRALEQVTPSKSTSSDPSTPLDDSFPNIQASTSATPGQEERSKLSASVKTMKLRLSDNSVEASQTKREINNSLKQRKKSQVRKRKLEVQEEENENENVFNTSNTPTQRKLLHTPRKGSSSRSPLRVLNGAGGLKDLKKRTTASKASPVSTRRVFGSSSSSKEMPHLYGKGRLRLVQVDHKTSAFGTSTTVRKKKSSQYVTTPPPTSSLKAAPLLSSHSKTTPAKTPIGSGYSYGGAVISPMMEDSTSVKAKKKAPCNCKKSKCLKLYCECFASGGYCDESCNCVGCANTPATEELRQQARALRLEKNPNAFQPKIEPSAGAARAVAVDTVVPIAHVTTTTPLTGSIKKMHKNGCHCKKSMCRKKYCECFQAGVPCGDNCRCMDCKNQPLCTHHQMTATTSSQVETESFVSPVGLRRPRIDRETWTKNFSSPFEVSPRSERERYRSQLKTAAAVSGVASSNFIGKISALQQNKKTNQSVTPKAASSTTAVAGNKPPLAVETPNGTREQSVNHPLLSPEATRKGNEFVTPQAPNKRSVSSMDVSTASSLDQTSTIEAAAAVVERKENAALLLQKEEEPIAVYPLFGDHLPPLKEEVTAKIFQSLTNADLYNASLVSHLWNHLTLGDSVWDHENFFFRDDEEEQVVN